MSQKFLSVKEVAELLGKTERQVRNICKAGNLSCKLEYNENKRGGCFYYSIPVDSLPVEAQMKHFNSINNNITDNKPADSPIIRNPEDEINLLNSMKPFEREYVEEWYNILIKTQNMKRTEIVSFCNTYSPRNKSVKLSRSTLYTNRNRFKSYGYAGLIPKWGKSGSSISTVPDVAFEYFKSLYLVERGSSVAVCHSAAFGYFKNNINSEITFKEFPSAAAFLRRLQSEIPKHHIDYARKGKQHFKRHSEYYIARDWSEIPAGDLWVGDHNLMDIIVKLEDGSTCRPWITAFADNRTGKMLSYFIHPDAPNSTHVFYAFHIAQAKYGLPKYMYLDNGKDYKVRDFSGRKKHVVWDKANEDRARSLLGPLNIEIIFAREFNSQAKVIERSFKEVVNRLYKLTPYGYTGSNTVEKPENLNKDVKSGKIYSYYEIEQLAETFFETVFNKEPSKGKALGGLSRDQAWEKYRSTEIRMLSPNATSFCLMRTSKDFTIGRNGIVDTTTGLELIYWSDTFHEMVGKRVYLRRNLKDFRDAYVFDAETDQAICIAKLDHRIPGITTTPIAQADLKEHIKRKAESSKKAKANTQTIGRIGLADVLKDLATAADDKNKANDIQSDKQQNIIYQLTPIDNAINAQNQIDKQYNSSLLTKIAPPATPEKKKIYAWESEKELDQKRQLIKEAI